MVIVGDDPASRIYVRNKIKACGEVGIRSYSYELPADVSQSQLEGLLEELGREEKVQGILLQLPLPKGLDSVSALKKIPYEKDVDGFSAENIGKLALREKCTAACTPLGIMKLLESENIPLSGKRAVILGRSETVGKPMALLLLNADATVTVCHAKTRGIKEICRRGGYSRIRCGNTEICDGGYGERGRRGNRRGHEPRRKRQALRRCGL